VYIRTPKRIRIAKVSKMTTHLSLIFTKNANPVYYLNFLKSSLKNNVATLQSKSLNSILK